MNTSKQLMVLLLLLAYAGQSLAAVAMPCLMMGPAPDGSGTAANTYMPANADMAGMNHAGHQMKSADVTLQSGASSCCDGGLCSMSHCQSVVALPQTQLSGGLVVQAILHDVAVVTSHSPPIDTLFRPPISR
jgi:hypothetical protein